MKLFPKDCGAFVDKVAGALEAATGKKIEVMVYGDGAFKDPVGGIWELADPVVSPAYTAGLNGLPNELKLKYIADNQLGDLPAKEAEQRLIEKIREHRQTGSNVGVRVAGNDAASFDGPSGQPLRSDQRLRRQGHARRSDPGLFRQLRRA